MPISRDECELAYNKTIEANPQANIFETKAFKVLTTLNQKLGANYQKPPEERETFGGLMRETLNEHFLKGNEREAYASLMGFYFGNKQSKNKALVAHQAKPKTPPPVRVRMVGKQLTWDI